MNAFLLLRETPLQLPLPSASTRSAPARVRRVLVLDDDRFIRRFTALLLARAGYVADTAEDGEAGWDALCATPYDLLVTDNDMPRLSGIQLIKRLRLAGLTLPVIIASGSWELGEPRDYPALAVEAILHKPFAFSDLISAARRAVPIPPDAGKGSVHCLEPQQDDAVHFSFPVQANARPGVFAETA